MKLQISFDLTDLDKALEIASQVAPYASILEVGSLLIYKYGATAIQQFKKKFPDKDILADAKILDRGKEAVTVLTQGGADWVTVMAGTNKNTIHAVTSAAHDLHKKVMIDLLDACSVGQSALEAKSLGANALLFHEPYDVAESALFLDMWDMVRGNSTLPIFVSGKITRSMIDKIIQVKPDGIIIGKSITDSENPALEAKFFYEKIVQAS